MANRTIAAFASSDKIDEDEVELNLMMVHTARLVHFSGFWPSLCRRRLLALLDKDLEFVRGTKPIPSTSISDKFRAILDRHWKTFGAGVIDEVLTVGVAAVRQIPIKTGDLIPSVLSSEGLGKTHMITVRFDLHNNQNVYRVYRARSDKPGESQTWKIDKKAKVLYDFGHEPMLNGEIRSVAWKAVVWETYWQSMLKFSYEAEFLLMRPTIVAQQPPQGPAVSDTQRFAHYGDFAGADITETRGTYEASSTSADLARMQRQINDVQPGWTPPNAPVMAATPQHYRNVLTLAPGQTIARQQLPERNAGLPEIARMYESAVSALYGIPRETIEQSMSSAARSSDSKLAYDALRHTIMEFSTLMAKAYSWAYNEIYAQEELELSLERTRRRVKANGKKGAGMTEEEIFRKALKDARVRVVLSLPPTVTQGELFFLYVSGAIEWSEYHDSLRQRGGFTARQAPPRPSDASYFPPPEPVVATTGTKKDGTPDTTTTTPKVPRIETLAADYIMKNGGTK